MLEVTIGYLRVNLVAQHNQIVLDSKVSNGSKILTGKDAPCRILWSINDDHSRLWRDQRGQIIDIKAELFVFAQLQRHWLGLQEVDHRFIDREAGVWIDHLIALVNAGHHAKEHDRLGSGRDDHVIGIILGIPTCLVDIFGNGFARVRQSRSWTIMRKTLIERILCRLNHIRRRIEVRLADFKMDDVLPLCLEGTGLDKNFKSCFGSKARNAFGDMHGECEV